MNDRELKTQLERARQGDVNAFANVFENHRPTVYAIACRLAGPDDADDIVMETYLKAWRALPRFHRRAALKTWLYRIAHNCAMDFIRARSRRQDRVLPADEADDDKDQHDHRRQPRKRQRRSQRATEKVSDCVLPGEQAKQKHGVAFSDSGTA